MCRGTSFSWSLSSWDCFTFLWPQWNRSLFLWCVFFVETSLHWYIQNWLFVVANSGLMGLVNFVVLMASYILILYNVRTYFSESHHKALSTCSSHITVMILFFVPVIFVYIRPATTLPEDEVFTLFYTIIVPMLNPLIYTLRNMEMKNSIRRVWCNKRFWEGRLITWRSFIFEASLLITPSVADSLLLMGKSVRMCKSQAFNNSLPSVVLSLFSSQCVFLDFTFH